MSDSEPKEQVQATAVDATEATNSRDTSTELAKVPTNATSTSTATTSTPWKKLIAPVAYCCACAFAGFIFGWDVGTVGGLTNMTSFKTHFGSLNSSGEYALESIIVGLIISIFNACCAVGGLFLAKIADWNGRKSCIFVCLAIYQVGTVLQWSSVWSAKWYHFMIGRMITGFAIGTTSVVCPMYISESAPLSIRGTMVTMYQLMITFGILMGGIVNFGCKEHLSGNASWIVPVTLCHLWSFLVFAGLARAPESPSYFVAKGENTRAAESLAKLNKTGVEDALVVEELNKLVENKAATERATANSSWTDVFTGEPKNFKRLLTGVGIMLFQQFTGCNYFFYYGTSLFSSVGLDDGYKTAIILGVVNFVATFAGLVLVEALGRRSCFLLGSTGMFVCMLIYACLGSFALEDHDASVGAGMIVVTCFYIIFFACTWGPVAFVSVSELYNVKTKAMAMAIATSCNWIANFLISLFTPMITNKIGYKFGFVFAGCLLASAPFVYFYVPETKNAEPEAIDEMYRTNKLKA